MFDLGTCVLGWVFFIALCGISFGALKLGGGSDIWNISKTEHKAFMHVSRQRHLSPLHNLRSKRNLRRLQEA